MALPKRKTSKARRDKRRSHSALTPPVTEDCPQCHSPKLPHHVCPTCGTYAGRDVIEVKGSSK
jgi:large subunit ribosomal protein L32